MAKDDTGDFQFAISLSVLNHLGRNLYRNFVTVLGEAISNSWDADAKNVWIDIDRDNDRFIISDDGRGMTADDFQNRFLKIGYSKRKEGGQKSEHGRPFIGAKGIGKLALLSCARRVSIFTKTASTEYVGGVIDNAGLDNAITNDLVPEEYPLESLDFGLIDGLFKTHENGTIIVFEGASDVLRNSDEYIKKILALSFHFSIIDSDFTIHVNDEEINTTDLQSLADNTQFAWSINNFSDDFTEILKNIQEPPQNLETKLSIEGFIASTFLPRHLKISGMDERVSIDLFVNGRIRDKNVIRHVPTQRVVESYIYGQIHFNDLDREGSDPFTSSREGIVEDDEKFQALLDYIKRELLPKIFDDWDRLRLKHRNDGDDENKRKSKKERKASSFVAAAEEDFLPDNAADKDQVEEWLSNLRPDAEFNVSAYVDCFLSENLVRTYIKENKIPLLGPAQTEADEWKKREADRKSEANISFDIRKENDDLSYLGMDFLTICAEGAKAVDGKPTPLYVDSVNFRPVRNAVGHTGLLTENAKKHLNLTFENIRARIKTLLGSKN